MTKGRIAVLMPDIYDILEREFLDGIHTVLKDIGFDTLVFTGVYADGDESYTGGENNIYELAFCTDIDGVIVEARRFRDKKAKNLLLKRLEASGIPCVAVEEDYKGIEGVFDAQSRSIYEITEHLIDVHGYRDIICLTGPQGNMEAEARAAGFRNAMKKHRISKCSVIYGDFWRSKAAELADEIATGKRKCPEAIVCTSDIMAVSLCQSLSAHGIKIPDEVAVTGYDGSVYTLLTRPQITTVCGGEKSLGLLAAKKMAEKLGICYDNDCHAQYLRICGSCGCHNDVLEKEYLLQYTESVIRRQLERKTFMYSNYIAKMSDCESIPKFTAVLDSLRYMLPECSAINVCVCEDWRIEHPEYRKRGFSENMQLIYSEDQPGQLDFPVRKLLPCLNLPHEPQFWVFSSLHYSDRIIGYIASSYERAGQFSADEHYTGWCDAVANGLDIVIKKSNTEYIWQKLEEKNMTDIYTGLLSRRGFISKTSPDDSIVLVSFPKRCREMQYFVPIVSAVLRSDEDSSRAMYFGDAVFGISLKKASSDEFTEKICSALSELGIYISADEIEIVSNKLNNDTDTDALLTGMYAQLTETNMHRSSESYSEIFSNLRKEMKYSPQNRWSIAGAAVKTGLSGSHFQRLYKKYSGKSFTEELISFRMDRARYLLRNTTMPVQRIAEECGYTNPAHFMRQFSEREGMSAGQYRKAEKNE